MLLQCGKTVGCTVRLKVKEIAEAQGLTMTTLSHRSEVSFNTVRSIFRNPNRTVNTNTLHRLARALGVAVTDLLEDVPDSEPQK
ncbi:helix-turn-helix domain-containing protein [Ktedonosporobacter rubrisoli]|nr:helix-turn-helix transcriptional regulator [Ktedonosporobacter rubrisoli]